MIDGLTILLLVIALICILGLYGRFREGPETVRRLAREEIDKTRPEGEAQRRALREQVAREAGIILDGLKLFHEEYGELVRREIKASETRASAAERAARDVATSIEAATALVRELREMLDERGAERPVRAPSPKPAARADPDARETVEMRDRVAVLARPDSEEAPADADEPEEEPTRVAKPPPGARSASNGMRLLGARGAVPPPPSDRGSPVEGKPKR